MPDPPAADPAVDDDTVPQELRTLVAERLRGAGAAFAMLFGSRARGDHHQSSDVDIGAYWVTDPPAPFDVDLPPGVDLLVLNDAPLELAGRIALEGRPLYDDDPPERVRWIATTRKIYFDELPRILRSHREFAESVRRGR